MLSNKAFTLVELAIVIVIIGLLVGGALQGQELINQSKIKSQLRQLQEYDTASVTFKDKYGYLPGDLTASVQPASLTRCSYGFEGNGRVDMYTGAIPPSSTWCEGSYFFLNLYQAKLIKDNITIISGSFSVGDRFPNDKIGIGGIAPAHLADGVLYYYLGPSIKNDTSNDSGYFVTSLKPTLTPSQASTIDSKIDDGNPSTGSVKAATRSATVDTVLNNCIGATVADYNNTTPDDYKCRLLVKNAAQ